MFSHEKLNVYQKGYLDVCCRTGELEQSQRDGGIELLRRAALMLRALAGT